MLIFIYLPCKLLQYYTSAYLNALPYFTFPCRQDARRDVHIPSSKTADGFHMTSHISKPAFLCLSFFLTYTWNHTVFCAHILLSFSSNLFSFVSDTSTFSKHLPLSLSPFLLSLFGPRVSSSTACCTDSFRHNQQAI